MALNKKELILIMGFVLTYAFLVRGMMVVEDRDFWHDEAFQYEFSKEPVSFILDSNDVHPPLFILITKIVIETFDPSINSLRWFMVAISMCFLISLYYTINKTWGREEALITLMLASFTPTFAYYSTEFRSYIFVLLLVVWQIYYFNIMIRYDRNLFSAPVGVKAGWLWVLFSLLMIYSHYMAGLILLTQFVYLVVAERRLYIMKWLTMSLCAIPLGYYLIKTLPKIQSFWFKNIDLVSLISTFAYILSPPAERQIVWTILIYGITIFTMIYFRNSLTKKHLQFTMYVIHPIITMWIFSQFFPFYHHRYFLFGGVMLFPLCAWGIMQLSKRTIFNHEEAFMGMIFIISVFSLPYFIDTTFNTELRDSAIFLINETQEVTEQIYIIHTSSFSQTPLKVYMPDAKHLLYSNLTKEILFTAGGSLIKDNERIYELKAINNHTYFVSEKIAGQVLWTEGGLNVCRLV